MTEMEKEKLLDLMFANNERLMAELEKLTTNLAERKLADEKRDAELQMAQSLRRKKLNLTERTCRKRLTSFWLK